MDATASVPEMLDISKQIMTRGIFFSFNARRKSSTASVPPTFCGMKALEKVRFFDP